MLYAIRVLTQLKYNFDVKQAKKKIFKEQGEINK